MSMQLRLFDDVDGPVVPVAMDHERCDRRELLGAGCIEELEQLEQQWPAKTIWQIGVAEFLSTNERRELAEIRHDRLGDRR